ncbi:hypothetical protein VTN77DRAFT_8306 [Rasamsonia byssochlamydoides]|uniref:uncharacterized protein n=1 Tax=Rasamsonia byssochlamydoides TaxID=89139 RepID=UPI003742FFAF
MAVDYKRYLAENVLSERRTVTYRLLSRALKVHSNLAKQMLYEFHRTENAKKPQSVNATYIITGVRRPPEKPTTNGVKKDGDDEVMQSSPFMSSMPQPDDAEQSIRTTSFLLAREEDLADAKATFESISSIHIYSLQPNTLQDLNVLIDVGREIATTYGHEDPLEYGKQWGMTQNNHVKRRKGARMPPPPATATATGTTAPSKPAGVAKQISKKEESPQPKNESESEAASSKPTSQKTNPIKSTKNPAPVQRQKSDLFTSFAKAKPKKKTEEPTVSTASGAESAEPSAAEDVMFDDDDPSEEGREDLFLDTGERRSNKTRESRKEREEKLKKMMEEDDEDMPDAPATKDEPAPEESKPAESEKKSEPKEEITVQGGRRRGRRQVMKKKTIKDEEGYLVTIEEPVWESFSEDEPAPPKKKPAISASASSKGKKTGQGNIMSFFAKK